MLKGLFSGKAAEQVLLCLANFDEGDGKVIADTYGIALSTVQKRQCHHLIHHYYTTIFLLATLNDGECFFG